MKNVFIDPCPHAIIIIDIKVFANDSKLYNIRNPGDIELLKELQFFSSDKKYKYLIDINTF